MRIVPLPPCCLELNPREQSWDVLKDETANNVHRTIEALRYAFLPGLKHCWDDTMQVISSIGHPWLRNHANTSDPVYTEMK